MKLSNISAIALVAACLGLASVAGAQPRHPGPDHRVGSQRQAMPQHAGPVTAARPVPRAQHPAPRGPAMRTLHHRAAPQMSRGVGPNRQFHRGQRLPAEWRHRQHVVNDWRAHRLTPPPRGQQWVQVGADFALVAIATGVIASLILHH